MNIKTKFDNIEKWRIIELNKLFCLNCCLVKFYLKKTIIYIILIIMNLNFKNQKT